MYSVYRTYGQSSEYDLSTCVLRLMRTSVTHLSRMLLLWSFKAKREYNGVQRQRDFNRRADTRLRFHNDLLLLFALIQGLTLQY